MSAVICSICGADVREGAKFCTVCGAIAPVSELPAPVCRSCNTLLPKDASACPMCGMRVNQVKEETEPLESVAEEKPQGVSGEGAEPIPEPIPEPMPPTREKEPVREPVLAGAVASASPKTSYPPPQYQAPPRPAAPEPPRTTLKAGPARPPKGSKYEPLSGVGFLGVLLLAAIPVVGWVLLIIWACGGCRKVNKTAYARGVLLYTLVIVLVSAILFVVGRFLLWDWIQEITGVDLERGLHISIEGIFR